MRFNFLYILFPAVLFACVWIILDLEGQSAYTFFGTAESEAQVINFDQSVLVKEVRVEMGRLVRKGDTLAVLYRTDLDKAQADRLADVRQAEVERDARNEMLRKDEEVLIARQAGRISELEGQIRVIRTEDSIQVSLKKNIYDADSRNRVNPRLVQVAALEEAIRQVNRQTREQLDYINAQRRTNQQVSSARIAQLEQDLRFVASEKDKLVLLSPVEGYVEQVFVARNEVAQQYKELMRINPVKPNKIIGFIHENANVPFHIGDSVSLVSGTRVGILTRGMVTGCSPKLVELPIRLRKFMEVRAWGRELYIQMPDTNRFYIGEKIKVTLNAQSSAR